LRKRYSYLIEPFLLVIDLLVINIVVFVVYDKEYLNNKFLIYISLFWLLSSLIIGFYKFDRNTKLYQLIRLLFAQSSIFVLGYFSYFGFFREGDIVNNQSKILSFILALIWLIKFLMFYALKIYRARGNNYRKVIVLGGDESTKRITNTLKTDKELGYIYLGFFSDKRRESKEYLGLLNQSNAFILENEVDEIFCSVNDLNDIEIKKIIKFATINNRAVKLIPNSKEIFNKEFKSEFYGDSLLVLSVKELPLEIIENRVLKRFFDFTFSLIIIVFLLSWLFPLIFILIRIESKGHPIFKQSREGVNGGEFICYKFRSMHKNDIVDKGHTVKNDARITRIGAFLRKTSLDELPQFFNVLLGQMSVVGPRPHMNEHSQKFEKEVHNYMKRKSVRPGITGLAQTNGFRGEIKKKSDIENRVRFDVFYIKNWSFLLDVKIVFQTILFVFKGDDKAY
jgi:putative colanic acid biosynthesis UDP-glucose lipid carrier transferase